MTARSYTPSGTVTLLTDFGDKDPFVGVMKGILSWRFPEARLIDLCHGIEPGDIAEGCFWLERCYTWFVPGTVHVAVVDPGVGSPRRALAARGDGYFFVGPDNGLLAGALACARDAEVHKIDLAVLGIGPGQGAEPSATFHGRDVFAPAAAAIASGRLSLDAIGPRVAASVAPASPPPHVDAGVVVGRVATIDRFGNLVTNIPSRLVTAGSDTRVRIAGRELPLVRTYSDVARGELAAMIGSFHTVEIARRDASAAQALGVGKGTEVRMGAA